MESKICPICEKEFLTKDKNKIYCSRYCYNHQKKMCNICGGEFISNSYNQKVCKDCKPELIKQQRNRLTLKICKNCGEEFKGSPRRTTCKKCIDKINSQKAYKLIDDYNKLPDEDKQVRRDKIRKATKAAIDNVDVNKREEWQNKKSASLKQYYEKMTADEYKKYHDNLIKKAELRLLNTGYMWPVQMPEVLNSIGNKSKAEKVRKDIFEKEGYKVVIQTVVGTYRYDLQIGDTLIEINPFAFHNSTFAPPLKNAKPKHKMYHYKKTKYAIDNGYNIINIWDWTDAKVVMSLLNKKAYINRAPVLHRYNPKTREHIIDNGYKRIEMINKGFIEIWDGGEFYL